MNAYPELSVGDMARVANEAGKRQNPGQVGIVTGVSSASYIRTKTKENPTPRQWKRYKVKFDDGKELRIEGLYLEKV